MSEARYNDEIEECVRQQAEECDRLEGFVNFGDCFDGFAGVNQKLIQTVKDEYSRPSVLFACDAPWEKRTPYRSGTFSKTFF